MSQSPAISAVSTRFKVGIKRGLHPSSCRTSLELSGASFECSSFSTKCTVLLVHLSPSCFKATLRRRRLTSVFTGRVFHSSFVILEALFTSCPGRQPERGRFSFGRCEVRSSSSVRDPLFPPSRHPRDVWCGLPDRRGVCWLPHPALVADSVVTPCARAGASSALLARTHLQPSPHALQTA